MSESMLSIKKINYLTISLVATFFFWGSIAICQTKSKAVARSKPVNRFFGLHFDFHANESSTRLGETLTEAMLDSMLAKVRPDYVQVDCKGHPGIASYPTKIGTSAPGILKDPLQLWRDVTRKYNVPLYVHYSGVIDSKAIKLHPDWAAVNADGKPHHESTSVFSPYVDELLIPQFKELIQKYKIDGAWVDGDCWGAQVDYSTAALAAFKKETGIVTAPKPGDEKYGQFLEFHRKHFRKYLNHYIDAIHAFAPDFLITSNWAYTSMMPEPVDANVDFLSGDIATRSYVNNAALEARCLAPQGKPWDLMAWSFTYSWDDQLGIYKKPVQLKQEAAHALSTGGGFQIYYPQNSDASIKAWKVQDMADIARFCRERRAYTQGAISVPQIAILHSTEGYKNKAKGLYNNWNDIFLAEQGILNALLDGQHVVDILMEHTLKDKMNAYAVIVIPEWNYLAPEFCNDLLKYVYDGGSLIVAGANTAKLFQHKLGVKFDGDVKKQHWLFGYAKDLTAMITSMQPITLAAGTQPFGELYDEADPRFPSGVAGTIATYGKGKIAGVYMDMGESYVKSKSPVVRDYYSALVDELFKDPLVSVSGSHLVHVTFNKVGKNYALNLINMAGSHGDKEVFAYDEVSPLKDIKANIRLAKKPLSVTLQPGNQSLPFEYKSGKVYFEVPSLEIHSIVVIGEP